VKSYLINFIAIVLYTTLAGAFVGSGLLAWRGRGWLRAGGAGVALLAIGLLGLLTFMSTKYWFGDQEFFAPFIDIRIVEIIGAALVVLGGLALAGGFLAAGGFWMLRRLYTRRFGRALLGVGAALVALWGAGTYTLIQLSIPEQEQQLAVAAAAERELHVVPGFAISSYSDTGLKTLTSLTTGPAGQLYVAEMGGKIWRIADEGGSAAAPVLFAEGLDRPVGIVWRADLMYVAVHSKIITLRDTDGDQRADAQQTIVSGLPARLYPLHQNNALVFGPDDRLYFGLGSSSDYYAETNDRLATIVSVRADGSDFQVYARGLRNAFDLGFNRAGDMFAGENQPAGLPIVPGEELNHIVQGGDYGFPNHYEQPPIASGTRGPLYVFPPHASPTGIAFYQGQQFPAVYADNLFLASWMRGEIYRVQLIKNAEGEYLSRVSLFASGMLNPVDVTVGPGGQLFVADYGSGAIYRIDYRGTEHSVAQQAPQPQP
jgi:Glucose / Sorbosone dehydrogenase